MATNNFLEFNTSKSNMQTDAEYTAETQRTNGVVSGTAKSKMHNKLFRQVSVMCAAIGEFIKNAGYDASDVSVSALSSAITNSFASKASIDNINTFETAGGTATAITLSSAITTDKRSTTFIASANNSGAATKINNKPLYKVGTTSSPNLIAGKAYTIWYSASGACFFIKASAEGTAVAENVLADKTFSNDSDTGVTGNMTSFSGASVYCGAEGLDSINVYAGNQSYAQVKVKRSPVTGSNGYFDTSTLFETHIFNLLPGNIKAGTDIGGKGTLIGTFTSDGNIESGDLLSGKIGYSNGARKVGSMTNRSGTNNATSWFNNDGNTNVDLLVPQGYYDGSTYIYGTDNNLLPQNIIASKNIFGVQGTAKRVLSGKNLKNGSARWNTPSTGFTPSKVSYWVHNYVDQYGYSNFCHVWYDASISNAQYFYETYSLCYYDGNWQGNTGYWHSGSSTGRGEYKFLSGAINLEDGYTFVNSTGVCLALPNSIELGLYDNSAGTTYMISE